MSHAETLVLIPSLGRRAATARGLSASCSNHLSARDTRDHESLAAAQSFNSALEKTDVWCLLGDLEEITGGLFDKQSAHTVYFLYGLCTCVLKFGGFIGKARFMCVGIRDAGNANILNIYSSSQYTTMSSCVCEKANRM